MVDIFVGNTDNAWFDFLATRGDVTEVNFWKPSARNFSAIAEGELFAFRLKSPRNRVGGFGILSSSSVLPIQVAWETFGLDNGVRNLSELVSAIAKYRVDATISAATFIGCRILVQPVFLPQHLWFDLPGSWSPNIVGGKRFSTDTPEGAALWQTLHEHAGLWLPGGQNGFSEGATRFGAPTLITPRLGQGAFRIAVMESYERQCALTGGKVLPALDAAHIRPYTDGGAHAKSNGILLRKDIHSVFDSGYATIDENYRFVVSDRVRDVFNNGHEYRRLHGTKLRPPRQLVDYPALDALRWHNENRFLG